jgi:hypothetical protein
MIGKAIFLSVRLAGGYGVGIFIEIGIISNTSPAQGSVAIAV